MGVRFYVVGGLIRRYTERSATGGTAMVMVDDAVQQGFDFDLIEVEVDERAARRALRRQIATLERQIADAVITGFPHVHLDVAVRGADGPRILALGELERVRDDLAERLRAARLILQERGERESAARLLLEAMIADPAKHRFVRLPRADLGVGGCGNYEVRPRLGIIGMLAGWWHVKISSGCPLATG